MIHKSVIGCPRFLFSYTWTELLFGAFKVIFGEKEN